jgi:asparagine synthase (glutamine-hydrolysing)
MLHEDSYVFGTVSFEEQGVHAGWACHEGSFADCMPVTSEKGDITLLFAGEDHATKEALDQLKGQNHRFKKDNASYIVHMYEEKGEKFLADLNGWFSGLLVDTRSGKALLFNDRFGMQRIYWHEDRDAFYFSSEAKSLLRVKPELREFDPTGLAELMSCNAVMENRSLFKDVSILPGASAWSFNGGKAARKSYFDPASWEEQPLLDPEFFYQKLREKFVTLLPRYFTARQDMAISMTGGLDTRMIVANKKMSPGEVPFYTFGSMYRDNYDVAISRQIAGIKGQPYEPLDVDERFLADFSSWAEKAIYISDGNFDVTGSTEVFANRLARQVAPIRMTGNYGSEVLRSVRHFRPYKPGADILAPDLSPEVDQALDTYRAVDKGNSLSFTLFKEGPWFGYNRLALEQSQVTLRTPYTDNELLELVYRAPDEVRQSKDISHRLVGDGDPALAAIPTDRGLTGHSGLAEKVRHAYRQFLFKAEYAYDYGMPQWILGVDRIFTPLHLERVWLGRHKFFHFRIWYRDQLADYVRQVLLDPVTLKRPWLDGPRVEKMVQDHTRGVRNCTTGINRALTLELAHRLLLER